MDRAMKIFLSLCVLLVLIVDIQSVLRPVRDARLCGVVPPSHRPDFKAAGLIDGSYQSAFGEWVGGKTGFRGFFIKAENQLNYWLFREFPVNYPTRVVLGRSGNLFEKMYLDTYNRLDAVEASKLEEKVRNMKRLQTLLAARGIAFLFVIAPIKTTAYPEDIPSRYLRKNRLEKPSNYESIKPLLGQYGVNHIDGTSLFIEIKKKSPYPLFAKTGVHWNYYSSCLFAQELISTMQRLLRRKTPEIQITGITSSRKPRFLDDDALLVANLLFPQLLYDSYLYPETATRGADKSHRPDALFVGDSFMFPLLDHLLGNRIVSRCNLYYYFNTDYRYDEGGKTKGIDRERLDWEREVFNRDVVVIEVNEHWLGDIGFGFIEKALAALE